MTRKIAEFIEAASSGDIPKMQDCLRDGVDINATDPLGQTALHMAAHHGRLESVIFLVERNANIKALSQGGFSIAGYAKSAGHADIVAYLEQAEKGPVREWVRLGAASVMHVETSEDFAFQLKEVYNFSSRKILMVCCNLRTGAETSPPLVDFDDMPVQVTQNALEKFKALGGVADEEFVLQGNRRIDKSPRLVR